MAELKCGFCKRGREVEDECGELHHAVTSSGKPCTAHHKCMQYSALLIQYKSTHFGGFKISKVFDELSRGRSMCCAICKSKKRKRSKSSHVGVTGATCGCAVRQCRRTFHYYCAKTSEECITKRLVVSVKSTKKTTVLYRVFCSKEHEILYRQTLKEYSKDMNKTAEESEEDSEDSNRQEDDDDDDILRDGFDLSSQMLSEQVNENGHNTSLIPLNSDKENQGKDDNEDNDDDDDLPPVNFELSSPMSSKKININGHDTSYISVNSDIVNGRSKNNKNKNHSNSIAQRSASPDSLNSEENPPKAVKLDTKKKGLEAKDSKKQSTFSKKNRNETVKSDYALCILSSDENIESQRKEINTIVNDKYDVNDIVIWQDVTSHTLKSELSPYFIHALSKAIKSNSYKNLQNLLFSEKYLKDECVSDYEIHLSFIKDLKDPTVAHNVLQSTWKSVSKNLLDKSTDLGKEIGSVIPVYSSNVLVLLIGDEIDKKNIIRQKLKKLFKSTTKPTIFEWNNDTKLKKCRVEDFDQSEVDILLSHIMKKKSDIAEVINEPKDKILLKSNSQSNVVSSILQGLDSNDFNTDQDKSHCLVLVSPLDSTIVNCGNYIIKLIHNIITDNYDKYSKFSMVLPVSSLPSTFNSVENIKNSLNNDVTVAVYSAFNPEEQGISYIVAEINISEQSATNGLPVSSSQPVARRRLCVEDNEKPSTSGSNKKRRLKPTLSPSALNLQQMLNHST